MRLWSRGAAQEVASSVMGKLTSTPYQALERRQDYIPFGTAEELAGFRDDWAGYAGVLCTDPLGFAPAMPLPGIYAPPNLGYLRDGDVVSLSPSGTVRVLYRCSSKHNTILSTERCNSFCLMCSQPPKVVDDSYRVGEILRLLELIDPAAQEIVLSGGEPTLLGEDFLGIIDKAKRWLPSTGLHVLTNGRRFKDSNFAMRLGAIRHPDLMLGIPLYSDVDRLHDYVVQARGAFDETILGFYELAKARVRLELRVVLHKQTYQRLPRLAEFIGRNLPFVEHVALMGLEMFGFTPRNLDVLWVDPVVYQPQLEEATLALAARGMNVSIYNHQLCTIPRSLWPFARKSISDWKNVYLEVCDDCCVRQYCGGFFQSATKRHSAHIAALGPLSSAAELYMQNLHGVACVEYEQQTANKHAESLDVLDTTSS
jgi:His-Xaa-Ser system radical SAM maturase HxsC